MADNRPIPKAGAESEFDRGTGAKPFQAMASQPAKQGNQNIWALGAVALLIVGGGLYYYYTTYSAPVLVTPAITETTPPATTTAPEVVTPPAVTPDPMVAPKTTP
jgi:hypothetical protein